MENVVKKVTKVVTPSGEFRDGHQIIKIAQSIVNFLTRSSQRKHSLVQIIFLYDIPNIQLTDYPNTRVLIFSKLTQTLIANHYTFKFVKH